MAIDCMIKKNRIGLGCWIYFAEKLDHLRAVVKTLLTLGGFIKFREYLEGLCFKYLRRIQSMVFVVVGSSVESLDNFSLALTAVLSYLYSSRIPQNAAFPLVGVH
jgi:hypothetical protein